MICFESYDQFLPAILIWYCEEEKEKETAKIFIFVCKVRGKVIQWGGRPEQYIYWFFFYLKYFGNNPNVIISLFCSGSF